MNNKTNIILLPQTVEYYQNELTLLLENEQYIRATELLEFLLNCDTDDSRAVEEWQMLRQWLKTMLDEGVLEAQTESETEVQSEEEMLRQHLGRRIEQPGGYLEQLLEQLMGDVSLQEQMLALEQLAYVDHPRVPDTVRVWLMEKERHPLLQFKAAQVLRARGLQDTLRLPRNGKQVTIDIGNIPLRFDEFPSPIMEIMNKVQSMVEDGHAELFPFAKHIWEQFVSFVYGTTMYAAIIEHAVAADVWAAALHTIADSMIMGEERGESIREMYRISVGQQQVYDSAVEVLHIFLQQMMPPRP